MQILFCPKAVLRCLDKRLDIQYSLDLAISGLIVVLALPLIRNLPHFCLMQYILELPCPGCGVLRSIEAVRGLKFAAAWEANPAGLGLAVIGPWQIFTGLFGVAVPSLREAPLRALRYGTKAIGVLLFAVWIYRLSTH